METPVAVWERRTRLAGPGLSRSCWSRAGSKKRVATGGSAIRKRGVCGPGASREARVAGDKRVGWLRQPDDRGDDNAPIPRIARGGARTPGEAHGPGERPRRNGKI